MIDEKMIQLGWAAKALSEDDNFKVFMDSVRVDAYKEWSTSKPEETQKREDAYNLLRAIDQLKNNMDILAGNSAFEEKKAAIDEARKGKSNQPEQPKE